MATARRQNVRRSKWDDSGGPTSDSATEAAREAARKLNAMLAAKGKLTTNTTPPLLPTSTAVTNNDSSSSSQVFTEEIEINDSPRRLILCKGTVQYEINKYSGAAISTKGQYIPASEKANFEGQRPLYIHIQASSREKLNLAVKRVHEVLNGVDPFSTPAHPLPTQSSGLPAGMHYVQEKVFVGLDNVPPEFNLKEKIVGPNESYFQHITRETGAKVQLRGRGSGFIEPTSGREAFEALYIYISHNSYAGLNSAKKLVENLIQTVTNAYQTIQMQHSSNSHYSSGYRGPRPGPPHHPNMYMPPVQGYGMPPRGAPPYSPYRHPPNQYPLRYNHPQEAPSNSPFHSNPPMHPNRPLYPNRPPIPEGFRPRINEQPPQHPGPHPSPGMRPTYRPPFPPIPRQKPPDLPHFNNNSAMVQEQSRVQTTSDGESKSEKEIDEKPADPPKRRFTESIDNEKGLDQLLEAILSKPETMFAQLAVAPPKKTVPLEPPHDQSSTNPSEKQRYVSSLDQPSTPLSTPSCTSGDNQKTSFPVPVLPAPKPAPKGKPPSNMKDNTTSSGDFKSPVLPLPASIAITKKKLSPPSFEYMTVKKRKMEEPEKKSTGFALLGSYEDSSDEDS